jgi:serine/threonine-protein kinase
VPIVQGVFGAGGGTQFAWSPSGTVVYRPGSGTLAKAVPVRATRSGSTSPVDPDWIGPYSHPAVAPGGRQIAVTAGVAQGDIGIWIKQLPRGAFTRLTFGGQDRRPVWSPDGRTVAFVRDTLAGASVWARPADGSREPYRLSPPGIWAQGVAWSPDGTWLAIRTDNGDSTRGDIVGIRLGADGTPAPPVPLVASPFGELNPAFSPDGKWLAYTSDESGTNEVFVRPFPNTTAARWQVSNGSGEQPRWSPDGRALYYLERTGGRLVEARLRTAPAFEVLERVPLFAGDNVSIDPFHHSYDVWPDGSGFLFVRSSTDAAGTEPLVLGRHWFTDVRARLRQ